MVEVGAAEDELVVEEAWGSEEVEMMKISGVVVEVEEGARVEVLLAEPGASAVEVVEVERSKISLVVVVEASVVACEV